MKVYRAKRKEIHVKHSTSRYIALFLLVSAILLPGALMISSSIQASHQGSILSDIESSISEAKQDIRRLESEIITESSLSDVAKIAEEEGFVSPDELVYIQKESGVAQLQ